MCSNVTPFYRSSRHLALPIYLYVIIPCHGFDYHPVYALVRAPLRLWCEFIRISHPEYPPPHLVQVNNLPLVQNTVLTPILHRVLHFSPINIA